MSDLAYNNPVNELTTGQLIRCNKGELIAMMQNEMEWYADDGDEGRLDGIENIIYVLRNCDYAGRED